MTSFSLSHAPPLSQSLYGYSGDDFFLLFGPWVEQPEHQCPFGALLPWWIIRWDVGEVHSCSDSPVPSKSWLHSAVPLWLDCFLPAHSHLFLFSRETEYLPDFYFLVTPVNLSKGFKTSQVRLGWHFFMHYYLSLIYLQNQIKIHFFNLLLASVDLVV